MKEAEKRSILWVDPEHMYCWQAHFESLRDEGFNIVELKELQEKTILDEIKDCDAVVIHCGTLHPMAGLKDTLQKIKSSYPRIKIGLDTEVRHPLIEDLVDFYLDKPMSIDDLHENLVNVLDNP